MASKADISNINRLLGIIRKESAIDKYNLVMKSGLSISTYDKLKPFLESVYKHNVEYDRKTKIWKWLEQIEQVV